LHGSLLGEFLLEPVKMLSEVVHASEESRSADLYRSTDGCTVATWGKLHSPRAAARGVDGESVLGYFMVMSPEWNRRSILRFLAEGCTLDEAARLVGVHRQTLLRWR
jgi:hypothetical protein